MRGVLAPLRVEMAPRREPGLSLRRSRVVAPTAQEIIGKQTCAKSVQKVGLKSPHVHYAEGLRYQKWPFAFGQAGTHMGGGLRWRLSVCLSVCSGAN